MNKKQSTSWLLSLIPASIIALIPLGTCNATIISLTAAQASCPPYTESGSCSSCVWTAQGGTADISDVTITAAGTPKYFQNEIDKTNCTSATQTHEFNNENSIETETEWGVTVGVSGGWTAGPIGPHVDGKFEGKWGTKSKKTTKVGEKRTITVPACKAVKGWSRSRIYLDEKGEITGTRTCSYTAPDCNWNIFIWDYICKANNFRLGTPDTATWSGSSDDVNSISNKSKDSEYTPACESTSPCCGNQGTEPPGPPDWWTTDF